ncbi:lipopolysaccharide transport periplasmic protein LptA [Trichlorobacter lovleyi]|uniref:lipopolysaccharide transport periplasmic protein LptA n=1 Tax=Trichlorobacter lovleyi TaxID=313985 RepID=UPI0023EF8C4C|nr:lipopolysaccharide transport periplasmic protein LptA [Trichlorobacter lovleyi]
MGKIERILVLVSVWLLGVLPAVAASRPASGGAAARDRSSRPITIKADELKADNKGKIATFTGRVVARQEDVTIYSDKLVIYYGDKEDQVDKIEAVGAVRILQTNRIGTGGHALYENKEGKITLSGNPKVTQDKDSITGKVIVYYLDDDRSVVIGGENARVEAVIHPTKSAATLKKHDAKKQP